MRLYAFLAWALYARPSFAGKHEEIHVQWSICDRDAATVLRKLGEKVRDPYKNNPIVYFDTYPPTHAQQGVMFRKKVNKGEPFSLIKVRFNDKPEKAPGDRDCVWDRYGINTFYTCGERYSLSGKGKASQIWSDDQVEFAEQYDDIDWDGLVPYGPYPDGKWKLKLLGHKGKLDDVVAGKLHLMEIEVPLRKDGHEAVFRKMTDYLVERGVVLCDPQAPKTLRLFHEMGYL
ncbi:hypothetical protein FZEAL_6677 [Fusarium zealandicum]|uniref:Uncharacterized protein n=1 Tax=Fusarium zealandicum TaxID=1053134 RepID=A0A8H4UHB0_9HYPO|nr:hypothetical protein FZEAL_6677 [Fusarium zealandicum]